MLSLNAISQAQNDAAMPNKAQGKEIREKGHKKGNEGKNDLGLSADVDAKYKAIRQAHQDAVRKVEMDKSLAADAKTSQIAALKSKYEADVKGVMSADQYAKWTEKRAKRDARKGERAENRKEHNDKMGDDKDDEKTGGVKPTKEKMKDRGGKMKKDNTAMPSSN
jgi:hypothetical protein